MWQQVQDRLDGNGGGPIAHQRTPATRWLDGRFFDRHARPMRITYATRSITLGSVRQSKRYWYYISKPAGPNDARPLDRLPAGPLETVVREALLCQLSDRSWLADALTSAGSNPDGLAQALGRLEGIAAQNADRFFEARNQSLTACVHKIVLGHSAVTITCDLAPLLDAAKQGPVLAPPFAVPMSLHRNGRNRPIVLHTETSAPRRDADLIALVADARRWMEDLIQGRSKSVAEITEREQLRPGAVSRVLPLASLAPDITTAIIEGHQPAALNVKRLRDLPDLPLDWTEQRRILGFPSV
jgi:hypothetical protein